MEFIKRMRQRQETSHQEAILQEAEESFSVELYQGKELCYAYNGIPIIGISPDTTAEHIAEKLGNLRNEYYNKRIKAHGTRRIAAAF